MLSTDESYKYHVKFNKTDTAQKMYTVWFHL